MICGDCNEIVDPAEKKCGRIRQVSSCIDFNNMLKAWDMKDVPFIGNTFIWVRRKRREIVVCCLDRVMVNSEWRRQFLVSETEFLEMDESDHRPMIITVDYVQREHKGWFRYDKHLVEKIDFVDTISSAWNQTQIMEDWNKKT